MLRKELRPLFVPLALAAPAWLFAHVPYVVAAESGPVATFLSNTCIECHGPDVQEAGLRLDTLPLDPVKAAASADALRILVRVHDRVRDGEMPPPYAAQPSAADRRKFIASIEPVITAAESQAAAGTGRTTIRRMSRIEYGNTLRDLFALPTLAVKELLPEDGRKHGFDKVAGALDISYVQMQKYLEAATAALAQAVVRDMKPPERKVWHGKAIDQGTVRGAVNIHCGAPLIGRELARGLSTHIVGDPVANPGNCYRAASFGGTADSVAVFTGVIGAHQPEGIQPDGFKPPVAGFYKVRFSIWTRSNSSRRSTRRSPKTTRANGRPRRAKTWTPSAPCANTRSFMATATSRTSSALRCAASRSATSTRRRSSPPSRSSRPSSCRATGSHSTR
jgi:hypothetical protein